MGTFAKHRAFDQLFSIVNAYTQQTLTSLIQMYSDSRGQILNNIFLILYQLLALMSFEIYFIFFY